MKKSHYAYKKIASPKTWGEFKKIISDFPDDSIVSWINQPRQSIYERVPYPEEKQKERIIGFQ